MQPKHNYAIDTMRFISILAVLLIHTSTREIEAMRLNVAQVPFALFLNQIGRFAVPLFFMISGFVLELNHSNNKNYFIYIKKRIGKLFIPYLFWSALYYYLVYTRHTIDFAQTLLYGAASYQLYFIPSIIILYAAFPLIHKYLGILTNKYVLLFLGALEIYLLYQDYNAHSLNIFYPLNIAILNYYVFLLGAFAAKYQQSILNLSKKIKFLLFPAVAVSAYYVFNQGFSLYTKTHNYVFFYSSWRPSVLIYTILLGAALFFILKDFNNYIFNKLSRLSFFVFFVHVIVLEFLWYKIGINLYRGQIWFDFMFFLAVAAVSFLIAYIAHKIPYLSRLTG